MINNSSGSDILFVRPTPLPVCSSCVWWGQWGCAHTKGNASCKAKKNRVPLCFG